MDVELYCLQEIVWTVWIIIRLLSALTWQPLKENVHFLTFGKFIYWRIQKKLITIRLLSALTWQPHTENVHFLTFGNFIYWRIQNTNVLKRYLFPCFRATALSIFLVLLCLIYSHHNLHKLVHTRVWNRDKTYKSMKYNLRWEDGGNLPKIGVIHLVLMSQTWYSLNQILESNIILTCWL